MTIKELNIKNLKVPHKWTRLFFMIVFIVISRFVRLLIVLIAIIQFLIALFTNRTSENLLSFSRGLSTYIYEIMLFITYNSEERPFPFAKWPVGTPPPAARTGHNKRSRRGKKPTLKKVN